MARLYGRQYGGARAKDSAPTSHWCTTTLIAAVGTAGALAPMMIEGPIDGEVFVAWVRELLIPSLTPGDVVVMDNLSCHKDPEATRLLETAGMTVAFLPPYSPDLNPIERMWSKIKALLRGAKARTAETLEAAVAAALDAVTTEDIAGWYRYCGYEN